MTKTCHLCTRDLELERFGRNLTKSGQHGRSRTCLDCAAWYSARKNARKGGLPEPPRPTALAPYRAHRRDVRLPPDGDNGFTERLATYATVNRAIALKLSGGRPITEDLEQVGLIALWKIDTSRVHKNPDAYVRRAMQCAMIDYLRRWLGVDGEKAANASLDELLGRGQLDLDGMWHPNDL